mgnify:CR=1 FL=1
MRTLGRSLHKLLKPLAQKSGFVDARIFSHWRQIVGQDIATIAKPQKLSNNTLVLTVPNGAVALEVQHQSLQLIERINSHFGFCAVKKISTMQTYMSLEPAPVKQTKKPDVGAQTRAAAQVETVHDDTLREALARLGAQVEMHHSNTQNKETAI